MASNRPGSDAKKALAGFLKAPFDPHRTPYETSRVDLIYGDEARDTAVVIVTVANLEICLQSAIEKRFVELNSTETQELFGPDRPLSSFSSKIGLGYALGIVGKRARADLHRIRHIRNAFAHTPNHASFASDGVIEACNTLELPRRTRFGVSKATEPREKFVGTAQLLILGLYKFSQGKSMDINDPPDLYGGEASS